jgi:hypothetical protein
MSKMGSSPWGTNVVWPKSSPNDKGRRVAGRRQSRFYREFLPASGIRVTPMSRREAGVGDLQGREPRKSLEEVANDEQ